MGKIALANAHVAYALFQERFQSEKWIALQKAGAHVQRPLWASTGVKDPAYPDTLYVDQLLAAHTVNTMPPATLDAVLDHSAIDGDSISPQITISKKYVRDLEGTGISLATITTFLEEDGVKKFAQSWIDLLNSVKKEMK
jgi:transaldolase